MVASDPRRETAERHALDYVLVPYPGKLTRISRPTKDFCPRNTKEQACVCYRFDRCGVCAITPAVDEVELRLSHIVTELCEAVGATRERHYAQVGTKWDCEILGFCSRSI
mgnify:CR=1 FL=1